MKRDAIDSQASTHSPASFSRACLFQSVCPAREQTRPQSTSVEAWLGEEFPIWRERGLPVLDRQAKQNKCYGENIPTLVLAPTQSPRVRVADTYLWLVLRFPNRSRHSFLHRPSQITFPPP